MSRTAIFALTFVTTMVLSLSGCATQQSRRESATPIVRNTVKSISDFDTCFAQKLESSMFPPTFTPKSNGGTFTNAQSTSGLSLYVVDVADEGQIRKITLYAKGGLDGSQKKVLQVIEACI